MINSAYSVDVRFKRYACIVFEVQRLAPKRGVFMKDPRHDPSSILHSLVGPSRQVCGWHDSGESSLWRGRDLDTLPSRNERVNTVAGSHRCSLHDTAGPRSCRHIGAFPSKENASTRRWNKFATHGKPLNFYKTVISAVPFPGEVRVLRHRIRGALENYDQVYIRSDETEREAQVHEHETLSALRVVRGELETLTYGRAKFDEIYSVR